MRDERRHHRESGEEYGPTRGDWQRLALDALLAPIVNAASTVLLALAAVIRGARR